LDQIAFALRLRQQAVSPRIVATTSVRESRRRSLRRLFGLQRTPFQPRAQALAAAESACSPERAAALRLFAANLHKAFYAFEPDFLQHNLLRIVDDVVSVIKGSLQLWPTLVEICYFQRGRKGLPQTRVNNRHK
jgi:hypothetical protein